jgi:hypothetical protein
VNLRSAGRQSFEEFVRGQLTDTPLDTAQQRIPLGARDLSTPGDPLGHALRSGAARCDALQADITNWPFEGAKSQLLYIEITHVSHFGVPGPFDASCVRPWPGRVRAARHGGGAENAVCLRLLPFWRPGPVDGPSGLSAFH